MSDQNSAKGLNETERLVFNLCTKSFLSLWSYANPQGKTSGKELCDVLVVCEPDVVIFSVKEIAFSDEGNEEVNQARWFKRAIEDSAKQVYGAERWVDSAPRVIRKDGTPGLAFPDASVRRVHRIAVALGGSGKVRKSFGDFGKGFVHVFDEQSLDAVMGELDTITDFIKYLSDKEDYYRKGGTTIFDSGGEENLLAVYLHCGRAFPHDPELGTPDLMILDDDLWESFKLKPEYKRKKEADEHSYNWDRLIEIYCHDILNEHLESGSSPGELEVIARTMARENRFDRRVLGERFADFMRRSCPDVPKGIRVTSRMVPSSSGVTYVFLTRPRDYPRELRSEELKARCYIVRGVNPNSHQTVIGIATEQPEPDKGFTLDSFYLHMKEWTDEDQTRIEHIKRESNWFNNPQRIQMRPEEYPSQ